MGRQNRSVEQRKRARRDYAYRQQVADFDGCRIPGSRDFYWVTTLNISTDGVAFLSPRQPRTEFLVVSLNPGCVCVFSRVVWARCRMDLPERPFEIGCQFISKLETPVIA
jgi:hypothetical protein